MEPAHTIGCDLAAEVAANFGQVSLRVFGTSMVPAVLPGDVICIQRAAAKDVSPGEIIAFWREGRLCVHRAVAGNGGRTEDSLIARGDRSKHEDVVSDSQLIGRVTQIVRQGKKVSAAQSFPQRMISRLLRLSDRVTYLYLRLLTPPTNFRALGGQEEFD